MSELSSLPLFHHIAGKPVLVIGEGEAAGAKRRLVERAGGVVITDIEQGLQDGARIAFVAIDDGKACEAIAAQLRKAGLLVNVVDWPDLCDFTTPSILNRDPVLIAVGTGGASAGLAKHIRLRLEQILPQSLGPLANTLFRARAKLRQLYPDAAERRRVLDEALREGGALDALNPKTNELVEQWIDNRQAPPTPEVTEFTLSNPDPEELTLKQSRLLGEADIIYHDPRVPDVILARARADALRFPNSSLPEIQNANRTIVILHWKPKE